MSLQTRLADLITAIGADIKALQAAAGGTPNQYAASGVNQTVSGNSDTTLLGSTVAFPQGKIQFGTVYRFKFNVVKTAAATAAPVLTVRVGTAGSSLDAARCTLTFAAQTNVADEGTIEVDCVFRSSGASAQLQALGKLSHRLSVTGLSTAVTSCPINTSAAFDVTGANLKITCSLNAGASSNWTISFAAAEIVNLAA